MDIIENEPVVEFNKPEPHLSQSQPTAPDLEVETTDEAAPPPEPTVPKGVQKRIDRVTREKYEAQARAKMLEERINYLERQQPAPQQTQAQRLEDGEPTLDKFNNLDEYVAAKSSWIAKKLLTTELDSREQKQQQQRAQAAQQHTAESWNKKVLQATAEMPDFEDVIASSEVQMTEPMRYAIMESEIGTKVAYYLATNSDEANKIAGMSPIAAIRALGRIEEKLSSPVTKTVSSAPPPIKPVGTKSTVTKDPGQMSDAEYAKWRKTARH